MKRSVKSFMDKDHIHVHINTRIQYLTSKVQYTDNSLTSSITSCFYEGGSAIFNHLMLTDCCSFLLLFYFSIFIDIQKESMMMMK